MTSLPYNPTPLSLCTLLHTRIGEWFGLFRFRSPLFTEYLLVYFPSGTEMFYFPEYASYIICMIPTEVGGFPHSEISGSKVARHLPETYRSHATSFIAILSQGIHHTLLNFLLENLKTTQTESSPLTFQSVLLYPVTQNQSYNSSTPYSLTKNTKCHLLLLFFCITEWRPGRICLE